MMVARIAVTLSAIVAATACSAAPAVRSPQGFYVTTDIITRQASLPEPGVVASQAVQGVFIRVRWDKLEPRPGQFDWSLIDPIVREAAASHKKISIGLIAAAKSPAWLSSRGVQTASFTMNRKRCSSFTMPVPWDPGYISAYLTAMAAIRDRIQALGALDDVTIVKVSGIARTTLEMRLPQSSSCADNTPTWQSLGYRPSKIINAWSQMASGLDGLFPGRVLAIAILKGDGLPNIDERGQAVRRDQNHTTKDIVAKCIQAYGRRCAVQWNALNINAPLAESVAEAGRLGATIGWQTNLWEGPQVGAGCQAGRKVSTVACTPQTYQAILQRGRKTGAAFIEVWVPDAKRFSGALSAAAGGWK